MSIAATHSMTKRSILRRMLRTSAQQFGVKNADLLDPLAILFVESLAEEVYKLSDEVGNIESRMLETLSGMLCTDISLSAHPAHCILHAIPEESNNTLAKETAFVLDDKQQLPKGVKELTFYPVCDTPIRKGGVRYMIHGGLCFQIENDHTKTMFARSRNTEFARTNSFWIGLELDEAVDTLKDLSFYFDFSGLPNKEEYLRLLPFMTWKLNGKKIATRQGLYTTNTKKQEESATDLFEEWRTSERIDNAILDLYNKHFQTVIDDVNVSVEKIPFPAELVDYFPPHLPEDFKQPLLWLEIDYPSKLQATVIEAMSVCINAFPIANKCLHNKMLDMNHFLQVIPLETGNHESLLSVHSVTDALGRNYFELPFNDTAEQQNKTYSLRRGGYERYSKREQREYLDNLIHLLETRSSVNTDATPDDDEEAMLSAVHNLARHLRKAMLETKEKAEIQHYILIDEPDENEVFFVKYWTTHGEQGNQLKQHTMLDCASLDIPIDASSVFTLSATVGGKYAPQATDRQILRKKAMTDRTILVTNDDIINFCESEWGGWMEKATVSKGIMENPKDRLTFLRTTDITLVPLKGNDAVFGKFEIESFRQKLQKNSPATFKYRVFVKN